MATTPHVMLACESLALAGGVERFVCGLANAFSRQGMQVSVATAAPLPADWPYPLDEAVTRLGGLPGKSGRLDGVAGHESHGQILVTQWRIGRTIARLACEARPDVLILNGLTTAASVLLADRSLAPRTICCDHNHFDARSRPWRWLRARLYPRVAAVVSLTEADAARFRALNPRTEVIPNASALSAEGPSLPRDPRVLAVGRLVAQKGMDLLLAAWPQVLASVPGARLRIVGDGPLRAGLHAQAAALGITGSVEWVAHSERMADQYRAAAVFVLPSRYEGMPLALLEAQAMGVPSVAFDCPTGPAEVLSADTGLLVPPGDTAALARSVVELLVDPARRQTMAEAALARHRAMFSAERQVARWTALVRSVASRTHGRGLEVAA
ncbi:glycosyltransferase [Ideonella sp. YS5]|uniref:glycosyltransferase n=1 Tax=Ideonella sp. YS5 TaxID=3453714 RepID=UPI003EEA8508